MELWQRFTHRARRSILMAHDEASRMRHHLIGTEHLLLGLIRLGEGSATVILGDLGVDAGELREDVMRVTPRGDEEKPSSEISFTGEAQRVLQIAYGEARELGDEHIGTEHILLGLAREPRGGAFRALSRCDVDAEAVLDSIRVIEGSGVAGEQYSGGTDVTRAEKVALAARELLGRAHEAAADMRAHLERAEDLLEEIAGLVEADETQTGSAQKMKETLSSDRIPPAVGPYSQAVRAGDMIFCSGVIGMDPETKELVRDSFEAEVRRVMENLSVLLEDCGSGLGAVVKTTVFLADMDRFSAFNEIYGEYFDEDPPARSTVQVAALPLGAQIEVEAIAIA